LNRAVKLFELSVMVGAEIRFRKKLTKDTAEGLQMSDDVK